LETDVRGFFSRLGAQARPSLHYPSRSGEVYVFSVMQDGYEEPFRVPLELPARSIDRETRQVTREVPPREFVREVDAFDRLLPDLLRTRSGRFVAVYHGKIVDEDTDEFALAERIERTHRSEFVLIRRVCREPIDDHLESPEVEAT
jgi:hypothetical protein